VSITASTGNSATVAPAFRSILCGFDGCRPASEAARQAALLAAPNSRLQLLAINWHEGTGPSARATIATQHLSEALAHATDVVRDLGARVEVTTLEARNVANALLERAADHDLLVVGCHCRSRAEGLMIGSTATAALHRASTPVLIARRPPGPDDFPTAILIALYPDGNEQAIAQTAARIARAHHARIGIVSPGEGQIPGSERAVNRAVATIAAATGLEPARLPDGDPAHRTIPRAATDFGASLIVMGSRALTGLRALNSVSERVAHTAPCSVLVMRSRVERRS
jgi:nucleotide-binding universal stress UspA family protein